MNGLSLEVRDSLRTTATEALELLAVAQQKLQKASNWGLADLLLGGGAIISLVKHSRVDEAMGALRAARPSLQKLSQEVGALQGVALPKVEISELLRGFDIFLDNPISDFMVQKKIKNARVQVEQLMQEISALLEQLV